MFELLVLLAMIYLHISDDFINQGILKDLKQKKYWYSIDCKKYKKNIYLNDWIPVIILHGFKWSISIHIPIIIYHIAMNNIDPFNTRLLMVTIILNTIFHAVIDDLKCNKFKINLIQDQLFHILQILIIYGINYILFM